MIVETAYAKLNLALHVRARRADGYHDLESLFAFCADGDVLSGEATDDGAIRLRLSGPFGEALDGGEDNLVMRAALALQAAAGVGEGAELHLAKHLPIAAGLGGGSADAAAALRLLVRLWGVRPMDVDLFEIAASLGADVPACLASATMFGSGVGDRLRAVDLDLSGMPVLLVNPGVACLTGPVFRAWDGVDRGPLDPASWREGRNDLADPALRLVPEIGDVLAVLSAVEGATIVRMSGSGATCFALFDTPQARGSAASDIVRRYPRWWLLASTLR